MLIRTVRLVIQPDLTSTFLEIFNDSKPIILRSPGCRHVEVWQDTRFPNIFQTYSLWDSADDLEAYRETPFFENTWRRAKACFAGPPEARSYNLLESGE